MWHITFCSSKDTTPQRSTARQNYISKHTGILLVSGSSAIKPQTPVGNRKYINIVQADRGWRPSENNNKHVELVPIWGWGGIGKGNLNPRLSVENRSDTCILYKPLQEAEGMEGHDR